jgi:hypothetical protein
MAEAIREGACAGVGLGRPAASDPALPNEIIQKRVAGATKMKFSPDDLTMSTLATGIQMLELAQGQPTIDLSDTQELARFQEFVSQHLREHARKLGEGVFDPRITYSSLPARNPVGF